MSKIIVILFLIIFIYLHQVFLIFNVSAVATCQASGIAYSPTFFFENSTIIPLNFSVNNTQTLSFINGKEARLNFGTGILPGQTSLSNPTTASSNFTLSLTDEALRRRGEHWGRLEVKNPNNNTFEEFCTDIKYQVGSANKCTIGTIQNQIPPGSILTISFFGLANTSYNLSSGTTQEVIQRSILKNIQTDSQGQGVFENIPIPGFNGDSVQLTVWTAASYSSSYACSTNILITAAAPSPTPLPTTAPGQPTPTFAPVLPGSGGTATAPKCTEADVKAGKCTSGGGISCGADGIATAIGCIHTTPAALVNDILKFLIGIAGGIALLLMVLGAFEMITSAGNPETLKGGQDRFTQAFIGLLFVVFSVLLLQLIGVDILGIPGFVR